MRSSGLAIIFIIALAGTGNAAEQYWKAGSAKAIITPETPVWLAGYGSKRVPSGKIHELWLKAVALEDQNGNRAVLITSDFQGVPKSMSDRVFSKLKRDFQLERSQVMFTFSHNHCGPRLGDDLYDYYPVEIEQERLIEEYTAKMVDRTVEVVGQAIAKLKPAVLKTGQGKTRFAVIRRNNREVDVPNLIAEGKPLEGPVDHAVPVLSISSPEGKLEVLLFGYACHPTTLSFTKWCGDYPGFAQLKLEENHPGAMAMFVNTCGGDQNPLPRRTVELCQKYGYLLADAVEEALEGPLQNVSNQLNVAFEFVNLEYRKTVDREELQAAARSDRAIRKRWALRMQQKLDAGEDMASSYPYPIHAWRLGTEMLVIGMGAETVVDYSLRFKVEYGPRTWVMGYVDDMVAYIPSRRLLSEGGYEGGANIYEYGHPATSWNWDVERQIAVTVQKLVQQVKTE